MLKHPVAYQIVYLLQKTVPEWIVGLKMSAERENYVGRFYQAGYKEHDVENLSQITVEELQKEINVTKPGPKYTIAKLATELISVMGSWAIVWSNFLLTHYAYQKGLLSLFMYRSLEEVQTGP